MKAEIRDFLRKHLTNPGHAHYLTRADFVAMGVSSAALAHLNISHNSTAADIGKLDMVAARRLAGTLGLQLDQWERYFTMLNELRRLGVFSSGTTLPSAETATALGAIEEIVAELEGIQNVADSVTEMCRAQRVALYREKKGESEELGENKTARESVTKPLVIVGVASVTLAIGFLFFAKNRK